MNTEYIKNFIDICHEAKKITEMMPKLPRGMKPRHIHVIESIVSLSEKNAYVRVSDVSDALRITKPSVTKLINELEEMSIVVKHTHATDKRIISLSLTDLGMQYYRTYVGEYFSHLSKLFEDVREEDIDLTIQTIRKLYNIMKEDIS